MGKPWYTSKTVWFNLLALAVAVAAAFGFADFKADPAVEQAAFVIVTVVNLALRFVTTRPIIGTPAE